MTEEKVTNVRLGEYLNRRLAEGLAFLIERQPGASWDEEKLIRHAVGFGLNHLIRQHVRKRTLLEGICNRFGPGQKNERIVVENLSKGGIGFKTIDENYLKVNEVLEVEFILDDENRSVVSKRVIVRHVYDRAVGAEFFEEDDPAGKRLDDFMVAHSFNGDGNSLQMGKSQHQ